MGRSHGRERLRARREEGNKKTKKESRETRCGIDATGDGRRGKVREKEREAQEKGAGLSVRWRETEGLGESE